MRRRTPGPWKLFHENGVIEIVTDDGKAVVKWTGFDGSDYPDDAPSNARLIAAAPTLLETLRAFVDVSWPVDDPGYTLRKLRAHARTVVSAAEAPS